MQMVCHSGAGDDALKSQLLQFIHRVNSAAQLSHDTDNSAGFIKKNSRNPDVRHGCSGIVPYLSFNHYHLCFILQYKRILTHILQQQRRFSG